MPDRDVVVDLQAAEEFLQRGRSATDVIKALAQNGFGDIAEKILQIQKLRISGDYLQTSAIVLPGGRVSSAINDPNDYRGPGTGYRLSPERASEINDIPQALDPQRIGVRKADTTPPLLEEVPEVYQRRTDFQPFRRANLDKFMKNLT